METLLTKILFGTDKLKLVTNVLGVLVRLVSDHMCEGELIA